MTSRGEHAVSPVIAVILMVAVTVVLSAVVGAFVFNLGQGVDGGSTQSVGVQTTIDGSNLSISVITGEADEVRLLVNGSVQDTESPVNPGDTLTAPASADSKIAIIAINNGEKRVVSTQNPFSRNSGSSVTAPTDGLVTHYEFDSGSGTTAYDSVGSYDGSLINETAWTSPKVGDYSVGFGGYDDSVNTDLDSYISGRSNITVSGWFYLNQYNASWMRVYGSDNNVFDIFRSGPGTKSFTVRMGVGGTLYDIQSNNLSSGRWHHFAATYNGTEQRFYINNTLQGTNSMTGSIDNLGAFLKIGHRKTTKEAFDGRIDDFRVYNRALSKQEISDLYNATR